ncbi:MAG: hypothetical protein FWG91_09570 [Lachnospiraceae bacterium]|nr:hypothetical protein [Lachnospiraceae bacterium]
MKEQEVKNHIDRVKSELDSLLANGDRDSIVKSIVLLNQTWDVLFKRDDGLRLTKWFQEIWMDETAKGEHHIFAGIRSVEEVITKAKLIRHAFFRLENDLPPELCLAGLNNISEMQLSQTAFQAFLEREAENGDKIVSRINEITNSYA